MHIRVLQQFQQPTAKHNLEQEQEDVHHSSYTRLSKMSNEPKSEESNYHEAMPVFNVPWAMPEGSEFVGKQLLAQHFLVDLAHCVPRNFVQDLKLPRQLVCCKFLLCVSLKLF